MLDFGSSDNHSNRISYGDVAAFDGSTKHTLSYFLNLRTSPGGDRWVINKGGSSSQYILVGSGTVSDYVQVRHHDGVANDSAQASSGAYVVNETHHYMLTYDTSTNKYIGYRDGVLLTWTDDTISRDVGSSANPITLGGVGSPGSGGGIACRLGQVMFWNNWLGTLTDAQTLYLGEAIPNAEGLGLWVKGTENPGKDEISQNAGSATGTISLYSDPVDAYFTGSLLIKPWLEAFSRDLRRRRFPPEKYTMAVPLEFLVLELLDDLNISHDSFPRAASLLSSLDEHYLIDKWRSMYGLTNAIQVDLNNMRMYIPASNEEPNICHVWSTDILPDAVDGRFDGLAQMDQGATWNATRRSLTWCEQGDNRIVLLPSDRARMNHNGYLPCEAVTNLILNSNFQDNLTGWTEVENGGGTIDIDSATQPKLFVDTVLYPNACKIVLGSSGGTYIEQAISVSSSDGYRTLSLYTMNGVWEQGAVAGYQIQRASDSYTWLNGTGWDSSSWWNAAEDAEEWERAVSDPIVCDVTTTWTIRIGFDGGLTGDTVSIGQVDCTEGPYVVAPIITDSGSSYATAVDQRYLEIDV